MSLKYVNVENLFQYFEKKASDKFLFYFIRRSMSERNF